jgi:hypothetical protein
MLWVRVKFRVDNAGRDGKRARTLFASAFLSFTVSASVCRLVCWSFRCSLAKKAESFDIS